MSAYELFDLIYSYRNNPLFFVYGVILVICMYPFIKSAHEYLNAISSKNKVLQPEPAPSLNDEPTAQAIWQDINNGQFRHMLTCLQSALNQSGYQLTLNGNGTEMHAHREEQVADNLIRARELFWAPQQSEEEIENLVSSARRSGYSRKMLREMLACCARQNWHITPLLPKWELHAYPVRQAEVRVRGGMGTPVAELLPCLEELAKYVGESPSSRSDEDIHCRGVFPSAVPGAPDIEYEVRLRQVNTPPGFFMDAAGSRLPPCAIAEKDSLRTSFKTQVTVFVQSTSAPGTGTGARTAFYEFALSKIKNGALEGTDYVDDTGFTFVVNRTDSRLVPPESPQH